MKSDGRFEEQYDEMNELTFSMSPILQTNVPGMGGAAIHSPETFLTYNVACKVAEKHEYILLNIYDV